MNGWRFGVVWVLGVVLLAGGAVARGFNGFEVSNSRVPRDEILDGGPGRDGIPSIDRPRFVSAGEVVYLGDEDEVVSVVQGVMARAYPLRILVWHEIVNDVLGGRPIAITYCPLCGTAMVFDREVGERVLTFGVSGLLYQSDVLLYDRETESLWSQLKMKAVAGPLADTDLSWMESGQMTWRAWKGRYPAGQVLSTDTGVERDYDRLPYQGYESTERTLFPVPRHRDDLGNKAWVAGVRINGQPAAFALDALASIGSLEEVVAGVPIRVSYEDVERSVRIVNRATGESLPVVKAYWFAWQAFYPETRLWSGPEPRREAPADSSPSKL